jgi:hypothetical protein
VKPVASVRGSRRKASPSQAVEGNDSSIVDDRYLCMGADYCGELEAVFGTHDNSKFEPDEAPAADIIPTIKNVFSVHSLRSSMAHSKRTTFRSHASLLKRMVPYIARAISN